MTRGGVDLALGFTVTPDNVLAAYAVIAEEATRLGLALRFFQLGLGEGMPLCGGDPVSVDASRGFSEAAGELARLCYEDVAKLLAAADSLAKTAREYGKSDDQIVASFDRAKYTYQPSPVPTQTGSGPR